MAKQNKIGGPFLATAVLCNSVSEDSDGVVSALRIVDEVRAVIPPGSPVPSKAKPLDIALFALIMVRRGDARPGKHKLRLMMEQPSGKTKVLLKTDIEFPAHPNGTATVKAKMGMKLYTPGTFWIDVILDKQRLTRMALNLVLLLPETPAPQNPPQ